MAPAQIPADCNEVSALEAFRNDICDAIELMTYAISTVKALADTVIDQIEQAKNFLAEPPTAANRAEFEKAYRELARFMAPVTIETLHSTDDGRQGARRKTFRSIRISDARWFYWQLGFLTALCLALLLSIQMLSLFYGADEEQIHGFTSKLIAVGKATAPFLYGLLGALTFLLQSALKYIADRSFDFRRTPEYSNRMLLGTIAGGVVLLFVDPKTVGFTANAIAFAVGYNTDSLFKLLERVGNAIVGQTTPATPPPASTPAESTSSAAPASQGPSALAGCAITTSKSLARGGMGNLRITLNVPSSTDTPVTITADPAGAVGIATPATIAAGSLTADVPFRVNSAATQGAVVTLTATANGANVSTQATIA